MQQIECVFSPLSLKGNHRGGAGGGGTAAQNTHLVKNKIK